MLIISAMLFAGFIFWAVLMTDDIDDDDDGPDNGLLIPVNINNTL